MTTHLTTPIIAILALLAIITLVTQTTILTPTPPYSASLMQFTSDEGVTKAALTINGPATHLTFSGRPLLLDTRSSDNTFLTILSAKETTRLIETKRITFDAETNDTTATHTLPLDTHVTFDALDITRENNTIIIRTNITGLDTGSRVLIWTTVDETHVVLG